MKKYSATRSFTLFLILFCIFLIGFLYRFRGITQSHPFWVDEFSSGIQARSISQYGLAAFTHPIIPQEHNNTVTHFFIAASFLIFGESEQSARLPFVLIGSMVPLVLFALCWRLFQNKAVAYSAILLCTFSYLEILWSVQARGYVLQQFFILSIFYSYFHLISQKKSRTLLSILFFVLLTLGILTHSFLLLTLGSIFLHFIMTNRWNLKRIPLLVIFQLLAACGLLTGVLFLTGMFNVIVSYFSTSLFRSNNLWYYHAFLWREYSILTFTGVIGLVYGFFKKPKYFSAILLYVGVHLSFVTFGYGHYLSKYLLPIIPFLIIGSAVSISRFAEMIIQTDVFSKVWRVSVISPVMLVTIIFTSGLILNGDTFVSKPKVYYSLNRDFREIANVDYTQVYDRIKKKVDSSQEPVLIIETWPDRAYWYLGNEYQHISLFRWQDEVGSVSGHGKQTPFSVKGDGTKFLPWRPSVGYIGKASDLKIAQQKYSAGFLWIDDSSLPQEVIEYAEQKLKKELYLDHYPLDDNPYSIWPGTLYSWGVQ